MELRDICDDFIQIGDIAILNKRTGNDVYGFDFRNHFDCKSVVSEIDSPVLLHIGAVEDYEGLEEGYDYSQFSENSKKCIASCVSIAVSIKSVLDTQLLTDDGLLTDESGNIVVNTEEFINKIVFMSE